MNMFKAFRAGDTIYGYCNGFFGRDDYDNKICILVSAKYAIFEREDGTAVALNKSDMITLEITEQWKKEES